jgi:hypothetical protein
MTPSYYAYTSSAFVQKQVRRGCGPLADLVGVNAQPFQITTNQNASPRDQLPDDRGPLPTHWQYLQSKSVRPDADPKQKFYC